MDPQFGVPCWGGNVSCRPKLMTNRKMPWHLSTSFFCFTFRRAVKAKYYTKAYIQTSNNTISLVNFQKKKLYFASLYQKIILEYRKNASPTFVHITSHHLPPIEKNDPPPWRYLRCGSAQSTCTSSTGRTQPLSPVGVGIRPSWWSEKQRAVTRPESFGLLKKTKTSVSVRTFWKECRKVCTWKMLLKMRSLHLTKNYSESFPCHWHGKTKLLWISITWYALLKTESLCFTKFEPWFCRLSPMRRQKQIISMSFGKKP